MLYDNKSNHDLSTIYSFICESANDEEALQLAARIEKSFYTDKAKEANFGSEARRLGYRSVNDLMQKYDMYKRYVLGIKPKYTPSQHSQSKSIEQMRSELKDYGKTMVQQNRENFINTPHNINDIKYKKYYITRYNLINDTLNLLQQLKYVFTFEDVEGNMFDDMKCLRPHSINNRGKYRFAQFIKKMAPDAQIDNSIEFRPTRVINTNGPDFDINPNEIESIDINHGKIAITAKVPLELYCR